MAKADAHCSARRRRRIRQGSNPACDYKNIVRLLYSLSCTKDLASTQGFDVTVMSQICRVFHASKTWLPSMVSMSGSFKKMYSFFIHKRRGYEQGYLCPDTVRQLFWLPYTKLLASSQVVFYVGLLSDCYTDYSASKTWLQAIVLMSKFCQTVVVFRAPKT